VSVDELRERVLGGNAPYDHTLALMRSMERSRLVDLEVPEELVTGSWPVRNRTRSAGRGRPAAP
jgi:hypothetical protein